MSFKKILANKDIMKIFIISSQNDLSNNKLK